VQKRAKKLLHRKVNKRVSFVVKKDELLTTAMCCVTAPGNYVTPMLILERRKGKNEIKNGAPPGTMFAFNSESAFIDKEILLLWITSLINPVQPSREKKVMLLLDGHSTHIKTSQALEMAREHGVTPLSLPGHTTHRLQTSDLSFFKPRTSYYIDATVMH
jgi:hypothetical protein